MKKNKIDQFLSLGVDSGASDLHFRVGDKPAYRIDGRLKPVKHAPLNAEDTLEIARVLLGEDAEKVSLQELQEFDCSYSIPGSARFRVNIYRQRGSLCCILRVIPTEAPTIESLELPGGVRRLAGEERGLVLVTGATGSGKSSTLAAIIHHINHHRSDHILTIEDPIEFLHTNAKSSISQREIGPDTRNFTSALRSALRQDPDVILVGEMRDLETVDTALKAAETGHMVFSTVHTTDVSKTIGRLVGMFPAEEQQSARLRLADNLMGVVSQRLLPRKDAKGRVAAVEVMLSTKTVQEHIKDPDRTGGLKDVIERGRNEYDMQSFDQHLTDLFKAGVISREVALSAASNPSDFERALSFADTGMPGPNDSGDDDKPPGLDLDLGDAMELGEADIVE
jgi:twitching motility protein PilT